MSRYTNTRKHMHPGGGVCPWGEILPAPKSMTKVPTDLGRAELQQPPVHVVGCCASGQTHCELIYSWSGWGVAAWDTLEMCWNTAGERGLIPKPSPTRQQCYIAMLSRPSASHQSWSSFICVQVTRAFPGSDLAYLRGLEGVLGCLFGFGLETFFFLVFFYICLD